MMRHAVANPDDSQPEACVLKLRTYVHFRRKSFNGKPQATAKDGR
jgi:hypothetical protein